MWTYSGENSLVCDGHRNAVEAFDPYQVHTTEGSWCTMPGRIWLIEEHRCVIDDTGVEPPARAAAKELTPA